MIYIFMKYPEAGKVKTRLAKDTSPEYAAGLYKCFVEDIVDSFQNTKTPFTLSIAEEKSTEKTISWLGNVSTQVQCQGNLGDRMKNTFDTAFKKGGNRVIIIGSDAPDIPEKTFEEAEIALNSNDMVIGPCVDGGYYLIGFTAKGFTPEVFDNIEWSQSSVFEKTMEIANAKNIKTHSLKTHFDNDTLADIEALVARNMNTNFIHSKSLNFIKDNTYV